MDSLRPPEHMRFDEHRALSWNKWIQAFEWYLTAVGKSTSSDAVKTAILLTALGPEGQEIYGTFDGTDAASYAQVKDQFKSYCEPLVNETYERYLLRNLVQTEEDFDSFLNKVKLQVKRSGYDAPANGESINNSVIRDQIVSGVADDTVRERLLREPKLTMDQAVKICRAAEIAKRQVQQYTSATSTTGNVEMVRNRKPRHTATTSAKQQPPSSPACSCSRVRGSPRRASASSAATSARPWPPHGS